MNVCFLGCTPDPEATCALAARNCYSADSIDGIADLVLEKDQSRFLRGVIASGHHSVLEHVSFTFGISGVSRALLAQITRHRIASFSVQSQRYVGLENGFDYVIPPRIQALGDEEVGRFHSQMALIQSWYNEWREKLGGGEGANEDARFVLPNACCTQIVMTMNARELLNFFSLRCCNRAQWEIRAVADKMLEICKDHAPVIFESAGPGCVRGNCPEGKKCCGKPRKELVVDAQ